MSVRIGKVRYKNGTQLTILPPSHNNVHRVDLGWGEVVVRFYENHTMTKADIVYACRSAIDETMYGSK
jgi:Ser/Thr protein kinase RdoA (MazF antagonist)